MSEPNDERAEQRFYAPTQRVVVQACGHVTDHDQEVLRQARSHHEHLLSQAPPLARQKTLLVQRAVAEQPVRSCTHERTGHLTRPVRYQRVHLDTQAERNLVLKKPGHKAAAGKLPVGAKISHLVRAEGRDEPPQ